jgi:hypothetical protein
MKDTFKLYLTICLLSLLIKLVINAFKKIRGGRISLNHEKEHETGNYIKLFILALLGLALLYLLNSNTSLPNL